jgi:hypothetical protein
MNREARAEARRDRAGGHPLAASSLDHLEAAIVWLVRAHDATPDGGVSRGYSPAWIGHLGMRGWQPSYPETTGYIIPTFFDAAAALCRSDLRARALEMAAWECDIQLESGAVQGGTLDPTCLPTPAVFNTGQVMLGWLRAHAETSESRYLEAARRAGDFLVACQGPSGRFETGNSQFARADATTYNTRVAWPLCLLGHRLGERRYTIAGERNIDYAISEQYENGWFPNCCLSDPERPLLHTIAYAMRGILEVGLLLERRDYVASARRTARALAACQRASGGLSGRFSHNWSEMADWDCLTGDAQTAIIWYKLGELDADPELVESAHAACRFVMRTQNRTSSDLGLMGGIKGSFPFDGGYGAYEVLNWPTKFFADAILIGRKMGLG